MRTSCLFILFLFCTTTLASAGTITFTDPLDAYEYTVYDSSGNYIGQYTVNDTLVLDGTTNYQVFVKPNAISIWNDPIESVSYFNAYLPAVAGFMLFSLVIVGLFLIYRRVVGA